MNNLVTLGQKKSIAKPKTHVKQGMVKVKAGTSFFKTSRWAVELKMDEIKYGWGKKLTEKCVTAKGKKCLNE